MLEKDHHNRIDTGNHIPLRGDEHAGNEKDSGETLKSEGKGVDGGGLEVEESTVVNPEGQHDTGDDEELIKG